VTNNVDIVHVIYFNGVEEMEMKDTSLIDKINWPLLPLTATAMKI
jgi:hypothetical protein